MISVVIPCHNQAEYLRSALDSVLVQTRGDHELVIVDDASTDDTKGLVRQVILENPGRAMRLLRHPEQAGLSQSRNDGILAADGDYILPLDADDFLHPHFLELTAGVLDSNPAVGVVGTARVNFGAQLARIQAQGVDESLLPLVNQLGYCCLYRKTVWEQVGGYAINYPVMGYEDWEFWIACMKKGARFHQIDTVLWYYRVRENSMAQQTTKTHDFLMSRIVTRHPQFYLPETVTRAQKVVACKDKQTC